MRSVFAHQAVLFMTAEADIGAPGAAVTSVLCTHWGRQRPCSLAPHHAHAVRDGVEVRIRVVFAVDPAHEGAVRCRIERALATVHLCGPGATNTQWQLRNCAAAPPPPRPQKKLSRSPASFITQDESPGARPVEDAMLSDAVEVRGSSEHDSGPTRTVLVSRAAAVLEQGRERSADADATAERDAQPLQESVESDTEVNTCRTHQKSLLTLCCISTGSTDPRLLCIST